MSESEITRAAIVNQALVIGLGQQPNFSIDDDQSELGGIVDVVWPMIVDRAFGLHDWTFCRRTSKLDRRDETPVTGYAYAFDMPGDKVGDPLKFSRDPRFRDPVREYYLEARQVHTNEPVLYGRFRVLVDPAAWDPAFRAAFTTALASALAVPILQDVNLKETLEAQAFGSAQIRRSGGVGGEFGRLIAQNLAASPMGTPFGGNDVLVGARDTGPLSGDWWGR